MREQIRLPLYANSRIEPSENNREIRCTKRVDSLKTPCESLIRKSLFERKSHVTLLNGTGADVTRMPYGALKIILAGEVTINSGSASINENFQLTLNSVARIINQAPNTRVLITGHTDRTGKEADNQRLSWARAASVRDYFVSMGMSGARIITSGRGSSQPIASNDTQEGRALNRRVEILVYPPLQ